MNTYRVKLSDTSSLSKVQQIAAAFVQDINQGALKANTQLPSINEFSEANGVARDTIEKAYRKLKASGHVVSCPSRGIFVANRNKKKLKVLLVFNKLSSFKKIVYESLLQALGKEVKVDLHIHHYKPRLFREIVESNLGKYDYYVIMPHFYASADTQSYRSVLESIPSHELILLDKDIPDFQCTEKRIYQDFKQDIYEALINSAGLVQKYVAITLVFPQQVNHPKEIIEGVSLFCKEQKLTFQVVDKVSNEPLETGTIYIVIEEDDLAALIKKARKSGAILGKDIGIISFNETIFKELLDITVFTTDFKAMGKTAADLILGKGGACGKNPFHTIYRGSL